MAPVEQLGDDSWLMMCSVCYHMALYLPLYFVFVSFFSFFNLVLIS